MFSKEADVQQNGGASTASAMRSTGDGAGIGQREPEVQAILRRAPKWTIRWGSTLLFSLMLLLLLLAWLVEYPDTIRGPVKLSTRQPPVSVTSPTHGRLEHLFVAPRSYVRRRDVLAVMESPARYAEVQRLDAWTKSLPTVPVASQVVATTLPSGLSIGSLQEPYMNLQKAIDTYRAFLADSSYYQTHLWTLKRKLKNYDVLRDVIAAQQALSDTSVSLVEQHAKRQSRLFEQQMVPRVGVEQTKRDLTEARTQAANYEYQYTNADIQKSNTELAILELQQSRVERRRRTRRNVEKAFQTLREQISSWKEMHLLRAPVSGHVAFLKTLRENAPVEAHTAIFFVVPDSSEIIGRLSLPQRGIGKVEVGQRVRIELRGYPAQEMGHVIGRVEEVSLIPSDDRYRVRVRLPDGLKTTYGRELEPHLGMTGTASIIVEEHRVLFYIFNWLRHLLDG